jgi:nitroreductase
MTDTPAGWLDWTKELILGRRNFTARRLTAPGPTREQLDAILDAACSAPDHGELTPWRFVLVPEGRRERLGEVFREALLERDIEATARQQAEAADKALRAPCLLLAIVDLSPKDKPIPAMERYLSMGCAIQNMLLMARAMGFDSGLGSGQALGSAVFRRAFAVAEQEQACCFVSFGTATKAPPGHLRPGPAQVLTEFGEG